jgi:hypothetical protein
MCLPHTVAVQLRPSIGKGKGRREAGPFVEDAAGRQPKVNLTRDATGRRVPKRMSEGNSSEDAHLKSMSPFETDEHLQVARRGTLVAERIKLA